MNSATAWRLTKLTDQFYRASLLSSIAQQCYRRSDARGRRRECWSSSVGARSVWGPDDWSSCPYGRWRCPRACAGFTVRLDARRRSTQPSAMALVLRRSEHLAHASVDRGAHRSSAPRGGVRRGLGSRAGRDRGSWANRLRHARTGVSVEAWQRGERAPARPRRESVSGAGHPGLARTTPTRVASESPGRAAARLCPAPRRKPLARLPRGSYDATDKHSEGRRERLVAALARTPSTR